LSEELARKEKNRKKKERQREKRRWSLNKENQGDAMQSLEPEKELTPLEADISLEVVENSPNVTEAI